MDNKFHVPKIDRNNPIFWKMAIDSTATTIDAINHITTNPPIPQDPAQLSDHNKKKHTLRALILSTTPSDILNLLSISADPTPHDLLQAILEHLKTNTSTDHNYLRSEAENLRFTSGMTLDDYISKHHALRARMIASQFPNITDESTSVEFMIDDLRYNPDTVDIGRQLLAINPPTMKDFLHHFHRLNSYNLATPPIPTFTIYPNTLPRADTLPPTYHQRLPPRKPTPAPLPPGFRPCSFHQQFMRVPPNHTDDQCRDTRHPKFNKTAPSTKHENPHPAANNATSLNPSYYTPQYQYPIVPPPWAYNPYASLDPQPDNQHPDQPHEDSNVEGTFTLDSAAHPTHIKTPPTSLPRTANLSTRTAANHTTPCTHAGRIQIHLHPNHPSLRVPCVATTALHSNLISVRDTALQYGAVFFTPHSGYVVKLRDPNRPLIVATAPWHKNKYTLHSHPSPSRSPPHAFGVRTICPPRCTPRPKSKPAPKPKTPTTPIIRQTPSLPSRRHEKPLITPRLNRIPPTHRAPAPSPTTQSFFHWHVVLNHLNLKKLQRMALQNTLPLLPATLRQPPPPITCSTCPTAKQTPLPHPRHNHQHPVGTYLSSDTCGPFTPRSRHGNLHFVTYLDAHSRYLIAFFIPDRSAVKHTTPLAISFVTAQHGKPPSIYRTDNAREFQSNEMNNFYNTHGIQYRSNTPHQPQENSLAERINHTFVAATRAALHHSHLDESFWEDAMRDAIFKYNLTIHDSTGKSPYQLWHTKTPSLPRLYAFGQLGTIPYYQNPKKKLQPRADPARFMHNTSLSHIVVLNLRNNQYSHLRSIDFKPYFHHLDPLYHHPQSLATTVPQTITEATPPPHSLQEARQYPDHTEWAEAHNSELDNLNSSHTIQWVADSDIPPNTTIIPLKMTYRYKRSNTNNITRYKARCTVRGDRMKPYIHFDPNQVTYTAEPPSIRAIMCLTAAYNLLTDHFDISSAFLHEKYQHHQPVFVRQLPKFDGSFKHPCTAGKLVGNLYGTPPASHIYFEALARFLTSSGYTQTNSDPCLFYRHDTNGHIFITITIDDFFVAASNIKAIDTLYDQLRTRCSIRRMHNPKLFLNWVIERYQNGSIHISQPHTIRTILKKHNLTDCNPKPTPYADTSTSSSAKPCTPLTNDKTFTYPQTVGELRYLADSTRSDIAHAVSRLATAMQAPSTTHWGQLRYLLKYLKGSATHGILYERLPFEPLRSYADAGFANSSDRKSYSGIIHTLTDSPIMWKSAKQKTVALSTCEAEYLSASSAAQQSLWLRRLLTDIAHKPNSPTSLFLDNNAAIQVARHTAPTKHRKYIDLRCHFLHDLIKTNRITVKHLPSPQMLADLLTKPLKPHRFRALCSALNIVPPPSTATDSHQREGDCQIAQSPR